VEEPATPRREVVFAKRIGAGYCRFSYQIPPGVSREFRCTAGLHSQASPCSWAPASLDLRLVAPAEENHAGDGL